MKKTLSIILVLLMILSMAALCACSKETVDTTDNAGNTGNTGADTGTTTSPPASEGETEEEKMERLNNSKPNEYVGEKLDAGMEVLVAFLPPEMGSTTMVDLDNGFRSSFEAIGCTYTSTVFNIDTSQQITAVENFVTMGAAEVITMAFDPSLADTVAKAVEAGTYIACWGGVPAFEGFSLATGRDFEAIGELIANMMIAWADTQDGVVKTALLVNSANETYVMQTNAIVSTLEASDKIEIVYTSEAQEMSVDSGFNFAQEALTTDPNTRLFLGYTAGQALGINNYIVAQSGADLAAYGVFSADMDSTSDPLLEEGTAGTSCFRGYASCGLEQQYEYIFNLSKQLFYGEIEGGTYLEPLWVKTNFGFEYDER